MKVVKFIASVVLAACLLLVSSACSFEKVSTPTGFTVSDDYTLSWFAIPDARSYAVEIRPLPGVETQERTTRRTSLSLADLSEGEYELRVRSIGGRNSDIFSEWSEPISFHRDHESGILYEYINGGSEYAVAGAGTATGDLVIEEFYRNKPVTAIKLGAFRGNSEVENIVVGSRVTSIESRAFYSCVNLRSVTIPDGVENIDYSAFQSCTSLTEVTLPASLTKLNTLVFGYCTALKTVNLNEGLKEIGENAFYGCTALGSIEIPDGVETIGISAFGADTALESVKIGKDIRTVGKEAFRGATSLRSVEFSETENEITLGDYCFAETGLEEVVLPEGVVSIGQRAFSGTQSLASVTIPGTVTRIGINAFGETSLFNSQNGQAGDGLIYADKWLIGITDELWSTVESFDSSLFREETIGIADYAFYKFGEEESSGCPLLYSVDLPRSVKYVGAYSFAVSPSLYRFHALQEGGLKEIGDGAFIGCTGLVNVRFANGLERIGGNAFTECELLDNNPDHPDYLTPESVTSIGKDAFYNTKLYLDANKSVVYAGNWLVGYDYSVLEGIWSMSFDGELPENIVGVADYALGGCFKLQKIDLSNVKYIGKSAFTWCNALSSVVLNYNLTEIAPFAFYECSVLRNVEFPMSLQKIGRYAFFSTSLREINLADTFVTSIGEFAFYSSYDLETLSLPTDTLREIGEYAFFKCDRLEKVDLPDCLEKLGERAFAECVSLREVNFGSNLEEIGAHAFRNCALTEILLPDSVKTIGNSAFKYCHNVVSVSFGSNVETIGEYAFAYMEKLQNIVIPQTVKTIGEGAFCGCSGLRAVSLLGKPDYIGGNAFYGGNRITLYVSFGEAGSEWGAWNAWFRPVVWNCNFSEEGYVLSIMTGGENISNPHAYMGMSAPVREGYEFAGWSFSSDAQNAEITMGELPDYGEESLELFAVWLPNS